MTRPPGAPNLTRLVLPCSLALTVFVALVATGVDRRQALSLTAVVAVQGATGAVWWTLARGDRAAPVAELVGMGLAIGTLGSLLADQLLRTTPVASWAWLLPSLAAVIVGGGARWRGRARAGPPRTPASHRVDRRELVGVTCGVAIGFAALVRFWAEHPLRWSGWQAYYVDIPFHEALARSVSQFGPGDSVFVIGQSIRYHWYAHAWAGMATDIVTADPFVGITRVLPVVTAVGSVCLAYSWARRISSVPWAPAVAVLLFVGGAYIATPPGSGNHLFPLSPSQAFSTMWLLAVSLMITEHIAGRLRPWALGLVAVLAVGCMGGKVTHAAVVAGGLGVVVLGARGWEPAARRRAITVTVTVAAALSVAFVAVIAGGGRGGTGLTVAFDGTAASALRLRPLPWLIGAVLGTAAMVLAVSARWAGLLWLVTTDANRRRPEILYAIGVAGAGLVGASVFTQWGVSQLYFAMSASALVSVVSACGLAQALDTMAWRPPQMRHLWSSRHDMVVMAGAAGMGAAVLATALFVAGVRMGLLGAPLRWTAPFSAWALAAAVLAIIADRHRHAVDPVRLGATLAMVVLLCSALAAGALDIVRQARGLPSAGAAAPGARLAWTSGHADAARWLVNASDPADVVATNRFCNRPTERPPDCDARWVLVSALTGRRMLIEGFHFGVGVDEPPDWALRRIELALRFTNQPDADGARALWSRGVRWIWVDPAITATRSWEPYASPGFANDVAIVLRLEEPA